MLKKVLISGSNVGVCLVHGCDVCIDGYRRSFLTFEPSRQNIKNLVPVVSHLTGCRICLSCTTMHTQQGTFEHKSCPSFCSNMKFDGA